MSKPDITITKPETIAETTQNPEVRVIAETMAKYVKAHEKAHKPEAITTMGFTAPVPTVGGAQ